MDLDYYWIIPGKLAGAAYPFAHLREYYDVGFRAIVSLVPFPPTVFPLLDELEVKVLIKSLALFGAPDEKDSRKILRFIDKQIKKERPVLVHCLQGNGRTGVVLGQYLVWKGKSASEALDVVYGARPTAFDTPEQEMALKYFEDHVERIMS